MSDQRAQFKTADVLAAVGLDRKVWNNAVQRKLYEAAPPAGPAGHPRLFTVDDAIALYVLSHYSRIVGPAIAAQIATDVKAELDRVAAAGRDCPTLWIVFPAAGTWHRVVARPQLGVFTHAVDIDKARDVILTYAEEKLGWTRPA